MASTTKQTLKRAAKAFALAEKGSTEENEAFEALVSKMQKFIEPIIKAGLNAHAKVVIAEIHAAMKTRMGVAA